MDTTGYDVDLSFQLRFCDPALHIVLSRRSHLNILTTALSVPPDRQQAGWGFADPEREDLYLQLVSQIRADLIATGHLQRILVAVKSDAGISAAEKEGLRSQAKQCDLEWTKDATSALHLLVASTFTDYEVTPPATPAADREGATSAAGAAATPPLYFRTLARLGTRTLIHVW
ncbi:hypothetical protein V8E36_006580 [Tilletia maclaganii]